MGRLRLPKREKKRGRPPLESYVIEKPDIKDKERFLEWLRLKIIEYYDKGLDLSQRAIALELGVSKETVKLYLRRYLKDQYGENYYNNFKLAVIQEYLKRKEEEEKRKEELKQKLRITPKSKKEFLNRPIVKELMEKLDNMIELKKLSKSQRNTIINTWYHLVRLTQKSPEWFKEASREEVFKEVEKAIVFYAKEGKDANNFVSGIQSLQKWLGVQLLPPHITQEEYTGKYNNAQLVKWVRNRIVEKAIEIIERGEPIRINGLVFSPSDVVKAVKIMIFLFYTGSRKQALLNWEYLGKMNIDSDIVIRIYGETEFIVVRTKEKGKKGKSIEWTKLIPSSKAWILEGLRTTLKELNNLMELIKYMVKEAFSEFKEKFRDTIEFKDIIEDTELYLNMGKIYHIWRHTSAHSFLRATGYNMYLVSKILGWKKADNLKIYADPDLLSLLKARSEEKVEFCDRELEEKLLGLIK